MFVTEVLLDGIWVRRVMRGEVRIVVMMVLVVVVVVVAVLLVVVDGGAVASIKQLRFGATHGGETGGGDVKEWA